MVRFDTNPLTSVHWIAIALAALSGAIHLLLGVIVPALALRASFLVAGVGFFVGIGLVLAEYRRPLVYLLGIPFTAGQIVLWYVIVGPTLGTVGVLDAVDKLAQVVLVALLVVLYTRGR
ncbi:DUF7475 family protein [Halalkalicoccus subterraneus]|uniref:DUF7475 family protein n=1 Tax=Halalkalicoccus subterraneus TaxID=2675002 RepID=UPI000EFAA9EB|nr:hypothetical protein [Halalkalicoccus subterraneus]